ncbi:MAG: hypothetical protein Q9219_005798 [cf. Caloplaca sp. 3 TL-2023]
MGSSGLIESESRTENDSPVPFTVFQAHQPPPNVSIDPIKPSTVSSFRQIISILLPIRYPDKFFAESTANVTSSSLARVAVWHDRPPPAKRKQDEDAQGLTEALLSSRTPSAQASIASTPHLENPAGIVVGGIQCRLEQLPFHPSSITSANHSTTSPSGPRQFCYIQTLALLSPYRSQGIGIALVEAIISTLCTEKAYQGTVSIYAHVWEANKDALEWYVRRGFHVGEVVQGYYRRLKPAGARIVWKDLGVSDYLRG